jgi:hypothetical protein
MVFVSLGNATARVAFSSAVIGSCISSTFWKAHERPFAGNAATVDYSVTTQTADCLFTTAMPFYVCDDIPWDAVFGRDFMELCSQASGVSPSSTSVLLSLTLLRSVSNPFVDPLYYIHDEIIQFLNHIILRARENVSAAGDVDEGCHSCNQRRRPHVPYDYQGPSSCTLEAAAASLRSSAGDDSGMRLLRDVLLKQKITGVRASVFTDDFLQLQNILRLHGLSHVPDTIRQCKVVILQHLLNGDRDLNMFLNPFPCSSLTQV